MRKRSKECSLCLRVQVSGEIVFQMKETKTNLLKTIFQAFGEYVLVQEKRRQVPHIGFLKSARCGYPHNGLHESE